MATSVSRRRFFVKMKNGRNRPKPKPKLEPDKPKENDPIVADSARPQGDEFKSRARPSTARRRVAAPSKGTNWKPLVLGFCAVSGLVGFLVFLADLTDYRLPTAPEIPPSRNANAGLWQGRLPIREQRIVIGSGGGNGSASFGKEGALPTTGSPNERAPKRALNEVQCNGDVKITQENVAALGQCFQ